MQRGPALLLIPVIGDDEAVHHGFDGVLFVAVQADLIVQRVDRAIHAGAGEPSLADLLENGLVRAFAGTHQWGQDQHPGPIGQSLDPVHDLLRRLFDHFPTADGAVRDAGAGEQQTHVVVDLGHRPDRGARIVGGGLLVDADGRGEAFDVIHVGLIHLADELAGIRGQ